MSTYYISTLAELQAISSNLDAECVLLNDIDASSTKTWNPDGDDYLGFIPIGTYSFPFKGSFDGRGYTISNLYSRSKTPGGFSGLFGYWEHPGNNINNGTFSSDSHWEKGTGWTISGGTARVDSTSAGTLSQTGANLAIPIVAGYTYRLVYSIVSWGGAMSGSVTPSCGGVTLTTRSAYGTGYSETFTATTTDGLVFTPTSTAKFNLDNVSLHRVCSIKNLNMTNADFGVVQNASLDSLGLLCGSMDSITAESAVKVISGCDIQGKITLNQGKAYLGGGLVGRAIYCTITNSSSNAIIINSGLVNFNIGGFVGGTGICNINNCNSFGTISCSGAQNAGLDACIGGFCGNMGGYANTIFTDCRSSVSILVTTTTTNSSMRLFVGGFVGFCEGYPPTITRCKATGNITSSHNAGQCLGGFAGDFLGATKSYSTGSVSCKTAVPLSTTNKFIAGGFAGTLSAGTCEDCYSWGDVCRTGIAQKTNSEIGGFIGRTATTTTIRNCYSTGYVNQDAEFFGGFIGNKLGGTTTACYWDKNSSKTTVGKMGAGSATGITGLTTAQAVLKTSYVGFDFATVWKEGKTIVNPSRGSNITLWASKINDYDNFEIGDNDDDSIEYEIPTQNEIQFIAALESLIIGTTGDEWKLGSNKLDAPITPTNVTIKQQSEYGSSAIQPVKINTALLFVDFVARKLRETTYDADIEKYVSHDLTVLAEHITKSGITSIARQKNPDSILWCTLGDGTLLSFTYERDQNVLAWARHPLGGGGFAQSVCVLPGTPEDSIYLSVYRKRTGSVVTRNGETITRDNETVYFGEGENVFIEKLMPRSFNDTSTGFFVDCGITATNSNSSSIITGLGHLEGRTVKLLVDGKEADDAVVENGRVIVSFSGIANNTWKKANVGLAYTSLVQPLRIVTGDSHGAITKVPEMNASFLNTGGAFYGNDPTDLKAIDFSQVGLLNTSDIPGLFTGQCRLQMPGGFSVENPIYIASDKPLPLTLRSLMVRLERTSR